MQQELSQATNIPQIEAEISPPKPLPAQKMHKIVLAFIGIFTLVAVTYPISMWRVSQMDKFRGFHVKSLPDNLAHPLNQVTGAKVAPK